jgi:hypothetical protein
MAVDGESYQVLVVAYNHHLVGDTMARLRSRASVARVVAKIAGERARILTGTVADQLYVALTGHFYAIEHPGCVSVEMARAARASIERMRADAQWEVAWRVVEARGATLEPWLGVTKLDGDGCPQMGAREYQERVAL